MHRDSKNNMTVDHRRHVVHDHGGRGGRPAARLPVADGEPALTNDQGIGWADNEGPFSFDGASADGSLEGCAACG